MKRRVNVRFEVALAAVQRRLASGLLRCAVGHKYIQPAKKSVPSTYINPGINFNV